MSKYTIIPTHYTHLIEVSDDLEGEGPYLAFYPIAGIRVNLDREDDCTLYTVELDGRHRCNDRESLMLYDSINNIVSYCGAVFRYDYSICLERLVNQHITGMEVLNGL